MQTITYPASEVTQWLFDCKNLSSKCNMLVVAQNMQIFQMDAFINLQTNFRSGLQYYTSNEFPWVMLVLWSENYVMPMHAFAQKIIKFNV